MNSPVSSSSNHIRRLVSKSNMLRTVAVLGVTCIGLMGCSPVMEADRPAPVNMAKFKLGESRLDVIADVGAPSGTVKVHLPQSVLDRVGYRKPMTAPIIPVETTPVASTCNQSGDTLATGATPCAPAATQPVNAPVANPVPSSYCDAYKLYTEGHNGLSKGLVATGEVLGDVATLGLAEIFFTPLESATQNHKHTVLFCYAPNNKLAMIKNTNPS